jgi:hypothetical protein
VKKDLTKLYMYCAICEELRELDDLILDVRAGLAVCHLCVGPLITYDPDEHTSAEC